MFFLQTYITFLKVYLMEGGGGGWGQEEKTFNQNLYKELDSSLDPNVFLIVTKQVTSSILGKTFPSSVLKIIPVVSQFFNFIPTFCYKCLMHAYYECILGTGILLTLQTLWAKLATQFKHQNHMLKKRGKNCHQY